MVFVLLRHAIAVLELMERAVVTKDLWGNVQRSVLAAM